MKRGFTLIELLIVVLIIGILASFALPQYQKAVWKSRLTGLLPAVDAMSKAQTLYYLEHGTYAQFGNSASLPIDQDFVLLEVTPPRNTEYYCIRREATAEDMISLVGCSPFFLKYMAYIPFCGSMVVLYIMVKMELSLSR